MGAPDRDYRLRPLRDVRERAEVVQRGVLAAAVGDAAVLAAATTTAAERVTAARGALDEAVGRHVAPGEASRLALADRFVARRRHELALAIDAHTRARAAQDAQQGEVDLARAHLTRARADREVIERHFARWREERRKAAERKED